MFTFAVGIKKPVVGPDEQHQDCACVGIVVAVPDGRLHLFAESAEELEALGFAIAEAAEQMKQVPATNGTVAHG